MPLEEGFGQISICYGKNCTTFTLLQVSNCGDPEIVQGSREKCLQLLETVSMYRQLVQVGF